MERQKYITRSIIAIVTLLFSIQLSFSQSPYRDPIYKAYSRGKMDKWFQLMDSCEKNVNPNSFEEQLELISYYYGYTAWLIGAEKDDIAEEYIDKSEEIIDQLLEKSPDNATLLAYKGAYIAFTIGISNLKAIYLGRKSMRYIDKSIELDPENIQGNIEKGNSMYYRPSAFGGDKAEAIKYYIKAVESFEKQGLVVNNWMYINTMTALGQAYEATDQIQLAKSCYEKIMRIFPNFMWVEDELYPDMLKRNNL
ncbi:Tetratricopeptide repeat-containing protein [Aquimarina amphilecti]|uniref:Tetratricopeptide repeat-containing protein n=1 Tax=Aquimarina amphilecti TaxID=1038014 RepID=A0A1H7U7K0_AQUAM|nr:tetratricopeptide repeat protein [Aquimarina amphilecti]SEL92779.1 Tetratricopeptide repeat-containing protein [Aquimarina amphilecti]